MSIDLSIMPKLGFGLMRLPEKDGKIPSCVITTAEHFGLLEKSIDKNIVLQSLVFKLQMLLNS